MSVIAGVVCYALAFVGILGASADISKPLATELKISGWCAIWAAFFSALGTFLLMNGACA